MAFTDAIQYPKSIIESDVDNLIGRGKSKMEYNETNKL